MNHLAALAHVDGVLAQHIAAGRVATFAHVNPVVAVFLGWLMLGQPIAPSVFLGTVIIVPAVIVAISVP